jgi:hypothetical protein
MSWNYRVVHITAMETEAFAQAMSEQLFKQVA